ncbi:hypothetical protein BGZ73_000285 [Actinomortierella ambigua]|nr:hypothetical protein BGZ73_000285 [Actinomortierella ambigua]
MTRNLIELTHDAELHDTGAQLSLAFGYRCASTLIPKSEDFALYWFLRAAHQGNASAQYRAAVIYHQRALPSTSETMGHEEDIDALPHTQDCLKAAHWFREAALQGHLEAQFYLGNMYRGGEGIGRDYAEAAFWIRMAAEQGSPEAQTDLGNFYADGMGVKRNDTEAVRWFRAAAEQGYPSAQNNLGNMYDLGLGVEQSDQEAWRWFQGSATMGCGNAKFSVASFLELGQAVDRNYDEALEAYANASVFHSDPDATLHLRLMKAKDRQSLETNEEIVAWHLLKAEDGDPAAQYNVGLMYEKGLLGTKQDIRRAIQWYGKAAEHGHEMQPKGTTFFANRIHSSYQTLV